MCGPISRAGCTRSGDNSVRSSPDGSWCSLGRHPSDIHTVRDKITAALHWQQQNEKDQTLATLPPKRDVLLYESFKRIDKSWVVFSSIENFEGNRCIDLFLRPDGTYGFEEFRRDPEDAGSWTPVQYYSGVPYASKEGALIAATNATTWLEERLRDRSPFSG
jgi:hypothetical protein